MIEVDWDGNNWPPLRPRAYASCFASSRARRDNKGSSRPVGLAAPPRDALAHSGLSGLKTRPNAAWWPPKRAPKCGRARRIRPRAVGVAAAPPDSEDDVSVVARPRNAHHVRPATPAGSRGNRGALKGPSRGPGAPQSEAKGRRRGHQAHARSTRPLAAAFSSRQPERPVRSLDVSKRVSRCVSVGGDRLSGGVGALSMACGPHTWLSNGHRRCPGFAGAAATTAGQEE